MPAVVGGLVGAVRLLVTPSGVFAGMLLLQPRISAWRDATIPLAIGALIGATLGRAGTGRVPARVVRIAAALSGLGFAAPLLARAVVG